MASISSINFAALLPISGFLSKHLFTHSSPSSSPVYSLPATARRRGCVRCSLEEKTAGAANSKRSNSSMVASVVAAVSTEAGPAMALVDERMSTEGTGLPFGLSNNILGWILLGVFALIWSLYFIYTKDLDEDEDSGLSL